MGTCTSRSNIARCNVIRCIVDDVWSLEVLSSDVLSGYQATNALSSSWRIYDVSVMMQPNKLQNKTDTTDTLPSTAISNETTVVLLNVTSNEVVGSVVVWKQVLLMPSKANSGGYPGSAWLEDADRIRTFLALEPEFIFWLCNYRRITSRCFLLRSADAGKKQQQKCPKPRKI